MKGQFVGKVLIVEDELLIAKVAQAEFEDAGFEVIVAMTGPAALVQLEADAEISLLFTDIRMPGTPDGWGLAEAARQMYPQLPVIYATGFSAENPQPVDGGLVFSKPYRLSIVIEAARDLTTRAKH